MSDFGDHYAARSINLFSADEVETLELFLREYRAKGENMSAALAGRTFKLFLSVPFVVQGRATINSQGGLPWMEETANRLLEGWKKAQRQIARSSYSSPYRETKERIRECLRACGIEKPGDDDEYAYDLLPRLTDYLNGQIDRHKVNCDRIDRAKRNIINEMQRREERIVEALGLDVRDYNIEEMEGTIQALRWLPEKTLPTVYRKVAHKLAAHGRNDPIANLDDVVGIIHGLLVKVAQSKVREVVLENRIDRRDKTIKRLRRADADGEEFYRDLAQRLGIEGEPDDPKICARITDLKLDSDDVKKTRARLLTVAGLSDEDADLMSTYEIAHWVLSKFKNTDLGAAVSENEEACLKAARIADILLLDDSEGFNPDEATLLDTLTVVETRAMRAIEAMVEAESADASALLADVRKLTERPDLTDEEAIPIVSKWRLDALDCEILVKDNRQLTTQYSTAMRTVADTVTQINRTALLFGEASPNVTLPERVSWLADLLLRKYQGQKKMVETMCKVIRSTPGFEAGEAHPNNLAWAIRNWAQVAHDDRTTMIGMAAGFLVERGISVPTEEEYPCFLDRLKNMLEQLTGCAEVIDKAVEDRLRMAADQIADARRLSRGEEA